MLNPTALIIENLYSYFLVKPLLFPEISLPKNSANFVRVHNAKLRAQGEISFPCSKEIWENCCKESGHKLRMNAFAMFGNEADTADTAQRKFLKAASSWAFPIDRLQIDHDRCFLYLQRKTVMAAMVQQVLTDDKNSPEYGKLKKLPSRRVWLCNMQPTETETKELSFYRAKLLEDILRRVLEYSQWITVTEEETAEAKKGNGTEVLQLNVESVAGKPALKLVPIPPSKLRYATIRCGIVVDPLTGKMTNLRTSEYFSCRSNDMCLMAMHKYGVRVKDDSTFGALMDRLGAAAVTVDLMEVRFSSPVQIIRSGKGSTKGAAFILYNSARLESLLQSFDEKVRNGEYGELPTIDNINFDLLEEEEEWHLVFSYIFAFPNLIDNCLEQLEKGICAVHTIVRFLGDFTSLFSIYYRRIRILTQETRQHLMPCVYARIYLLKAVREVLNKTLALLDIEPVNFM